MTVQVVREDATARVEVCDHEGTSGAARRGDGDLALHRLSEDVADEVREGSADDDDRPEGAAE